MPFKMNTDEMLMLFHVLRSEQFDTYLLDGGEGGRRVVFNFLSHEIDEILGFSGHVCVLGNYISPNINMFLSLQLIVPITCTQIGNIPGGNRIGCVQVWFQVVFAIFKSSNLDFCFEAAHELLVPLLISILF